MTFQQLLAQRVVLFDGAMGTEIQRLDLGEDAWDGRVGCSEVLNRSAPEAILGIHRSYLDAGCDVIETNTFGANEVVLSEFGLAGEVEALNEAGGELARKAVDSSRDDRPRFVAGSMGPGTKLASLGQVDYDRLLSSYTRQAVGLLRGGVDLFIIETAQDLLVVKAAMHGIADAQGANGTALPLVVSVTVESTGTLLVGSEVEAVHAALEPFPVLAIGLNCATGPDDMGPYVRQLRRLFDGPVIVQPNAGLPRNVGGKTLYPLSIDDYAEAMLRFVRDDGVRIVGGCCGTTPRHLAALAKKLGAPSITPDARSGVRIGRPKARISSLYSAVDLCQDPGPFFVGERANTNGSRHFRERLLADDWDALVDVAREQVAEGAHAIDLCVAYAGRPEARDMRETLSRIVRQVNSPVFVDSTELPVMEAALKLYGGRAVINSVNLEDGEAKAARVFALAKRFGAAVIALTIDEEGMAKDVERKVSIAKRVFHIAVDRQGLRPADLIFDALTFTLGSGDVQLRGAGLDTLEAIRRIKAELPGVSTILGVSNISFGLAAASRQVLNSVFLSEAVAAGLDLAIVSVKHIRPLAAMSAEDIEAARNLIFDRGEEGGALFAFIRHFEKKAGTSERVEEAEEPDPAALVARAVVRGSKAGLESALSAELPTRGALGIINDLLIPAMKEVGELFGSGRMQLPFVLRSAEVMKYAVDFLTPHIQRSESREVTRIVLATVRGDVHDIGKNLVDIILTNNGFEVHNLGIKCEIDTILHRAQEVEAHAIGMSGLLVKSTAVMKDNLEEMQRRGLDIPVLLGGAALTPPYVYSDCASVYDGSVAYCADAFEGLAMMRRVQEGGFKEACEAERRRWTTGRRGPARTNREEPPAEAVNRNISPPVPPFWGSRVVVDIDLASVFGYLTEEVLFRGRWGYRRGKLSAEEYAELIEKTVRSEFEALKQRARDDKLLRPLVVYGYYPCNSAGDELIVYSPDEPDTEISRFHFPRQKGRGGKCVADYFLPENSGRMDLIAFQLATVGEVASAQSQALYKEGAYKDYLLFHGLAVETAEALAEYQHRVVRRELGIAGDDGEGIADFVVQKYRGSRYSFGYPACPDLRGNRTIVELLQAERIGIAMTEEDQMVPEQTTSAFIVHHPQAKYFAVD